MTPMLTVDACAMRLNCSASLVRRLIGAGKLPASKVGGLWRVEPDHLEAFIAGQRPVHQRSAPASHDADDQLTGSEHERFL